MTLECVLLVGLQGAGKSTLYRQRFAETHALVSMDLYPSARHKSSRLLRELGHALDAGRSVVLDNTNPTMEVRAPLIAAAIARGARLVAYHVDVTVDEARARNQSRQGRARVPDVAIFATAKKLEPPRHAEGFAAIYRARLGPTGFDVEEIDPEP